MSSYIKSVLGCIFLLDLVCILLPSGKTGKVVTNAFRFVTLAVLFSPVVTLVRQWKFEETYLTGVQSENYLFRVEELSVSQMIFDNFHLPCEVEAEEDQIVLRLENGREWEEEIKTALKELYGKEVVIEYEVDG